MLDPQARALLDLMVANGVPPVHTLTPADARRGLMSRLWTSPTVAEMLARAALDATGVYVDTIDGVEVRMSVSGDKLFVLLSGDAGKAPSPI